MVGIKSSSSKPALRSYHFGAILPTVYGSELLSCSELVDLIKQSVLDAKLSPVTDVAANFQEQGVSAVVVLKESHVAVHLWPERQVATVDIHVCNFSNDNQSKAARLAEILGTKLSGDGSLTKWCRMELAL